MKRCLSVLLSLTGVLLLVVVSSACKPETRSRPAQQVSAATAQPTATVDTAAAMVTVTTTVNEPPACQFNTAIPNNPLSSSSISAYVVSPLNPIFTNTSGMNIYGWLPDNEHLIMSRWNSDKKKATLDTLNTSTGLIQTYAERTDAGGDRPIWLPDLQAIAYTDFNFPKKPDSPPGVELWITRGNPSATQRLGEGVTLNSLTSDGAEPLKFLSSQKSTEPVALSVKTINATTSALQNIPLPAALSIDPTSTLDSSSKVEMPVRFIQRPATSQAMLLYKNGPPLLLDLNSSQICQINLDSYAAEALWSPDGRFLAMRTQRAPLDFTAPDALTILDTNNNEHYEIDLGTPVYDMAWSPNSRHLAVLAKKTDMPEGTVHQSLYLVDAITQEHRQLFPDYDFRGGADQRYQMAWSFNGKILAITCPVWPSDSPTITKDRLCTIQLIQPQ
jgi:hypothetical protein